VRSTPEVHTGWGTAGGANDVLDLKGTMNFPSGEFLNPGGGTVRLDGATLAAGGTNSIYTGNGKFDIASGVNTLQGNFIPNGSTGKSASYTVENTATLSLQNTSPVIHTAVTAVDFTMAPTSKLIVGGSGNAIAMSGNFSFQQTDPVNAWKYGATSGLGPDLIMNGGTSSNPATQTLEVGGINHGYLPGGFMDNFALDSLTVGAFTTVDLVDQYANATPSGWVSGDEALYLDALFGAAPGANGPTAVFDEMGLYVYLQNYGWLTDGIFQAPNGTQVLVIDAPVAVAVPAPDPLMGRGVPLLVMVGGFWFGVRLFERGKKFGGLGPIRNIIRRRVAVIGAG
jgi:hypothetical protein